MPIRVQLSRKQGWRMPENTIKVDRSTTFGNPFVANTDGGETAYDMVNLFRCWLNAEPECIGKYPDLEPRRLTILKRMPELRGRNLACWCKPGEACHADVLLEMAN